MNDIGALGLPRHFPLSESAALSGTLAQARGRPEVQAVEQRIAADPRFQDMKGKLIARGDGGGSVSEYHLSTWWTWRANQVGPDTADAELERFLTSDEIESLVCVWLFGDFVQEVTRIIDGVELWPINSMPYSSEKIEFINHVAGPLGNIMPAPRAALVQRVKGPKIFTISEKTVELGIGYRLNCLALLLNLLPGVKVSVCCTCSYYPEDWPPGVWNGGVSSSTVTDVIMDRGEIFKNEENIDVGTILDAYMRRSEHERNSIRIALERIQNAKGRVNKPENAALDLGIALERLLLDNERGDQLALNFRLRGAWLIGTNVEDRIATHDVLKQVYDIRSHIAHFGTSKKLKGYASYRGELAHHFQIAERIARKIICEGVPDWSSLLLGADQPS